MKRRAPLPKTEKALAVRGADELDFLESRAKATPLGAALVRAELRALRGRLEALVRFEGRETHEVGTALITLYMRHADAALGYPSFKAFLEGEFHEDPRRAYEAMAVARAATAELAEAKGARWVLRAAVWARIEGHPELADALDATVATVEGTPVPLRASTIRQIDEALGRRALPPPGEPAGRRLMKARQRVQVLTTRDASVAALAPSLSLDGGEVVVRTLARGPGALTALRKLYAAIWQGR